MRKVVHLEQLVAVEDIDAAVERCLTGLEPKLRYLISQQRNFELIVNATKENKRRYRFKTKVSETFDLE